MAVAVGTNCGFVTASPSADPSGSTSTWDEKALAFKDTCPAGVNTVTEIGWWCDNATEEANFEVGIYDHNAGDDNPEAVVGSLSQTNAKGTDAGWKKVTGLSIPVTPATVYWIAVQIDNTASATLGNYTAGGGYKWDNKTSQTTLTDPWGASSGSDSSNLPALYALVENVGAAGSTVNEENNLYVY